MRLILISIIIFLPSLLHGAKQSEIGDIYIEANGNNIYEAKFKAHVQGMQRALIMIADKMGIAYEDIDAATPLRLKDAFLVTNVTSEKQGSESYSASVTYSYDLQAVKELLFDFGNNDLKAKFSEYLIFPVFKQRKINNIWEPNAGWNDRWLSYANQMKDYNLILGTAHKEMNKYITPTNIFDLDYQDYVENFWPVLFKNVLLVVAEYFTEMDNGKTILSIKYIDIAPKNIKKVFGQEYIINNLNEADSVIGSVIEKTLQQYGVQKDGFITSDIVYSIGIDNQDSEINNFDAANNSPKQINFRAEIFDDEELQQIGEKLSRISEIESFQIIAEQKNKFKILVLTNYSDADIAESFYQNGLSFKIYGDIYKLIDIKEGG